MIPPFTRKVIPFSLKTLQRDSNCIAIQDPSQVWGVQDFPPSSYSSDDKLAWGATKNVDWVQRNPLIYTDDLTNAAWTKSSTTAPSAGLLQCSAATAAHEFRSATGPITPVVGQTYYLSCKAKQGTTPYVQLACFNGMHATAYANFDLSSGSAGTSASCTPTITGPDGNGYYTITIAVVATGTPAASGFRLSIQQSASDTRQQSWAAAGTENVNVKNIGLYVGSLPSYQAIGASWDATYTANAIAAGYPISLWQDSAGTTAVNGDNQAIGKMLNYKLNGLYDATQSTTANQPKWRLDANGKPYIERDLTNDSLPITLPTVLSDEQLGPELVTNGTFTGSATGWALSANVSYSNNAIVFDGGSASAYARQENVTTEGKTYQVGFTISSYTSGGLRFMGGAGGSAITMPVAAYTGAGDYSFVFTASSVTAGRFWAYSHTTAFNGTVDNISVREVTGTNVVYTAEGNVTLKDSGLILSGSYAPITPAADYGRIIMAADSRYDAKILKYLDGKRGRVYSLGPDIFGTLIFTTGWAVVGGGAAVSANSFSSTAAGGLTRTFAGLTSGRTYLLTVSYTKTQSAIEFSINNNVGSRTENILFSYGSSGFYQAVFTAGGLYPNSLYLRLSGTDTVSNVTASVREVILS